MDLILGRAAIFVLLLVICFRVSAAWLLFKGSSPLLRMIFAAAFAGLCIVSLRTRKTDLTADAASTDWLGLVLLPYEVLVASLLCILIVLFLARLLDRAPDYRKHDDKKRQHKR